MPIKIIRLLQLFSYTLVTSQVLFYLFILSDSLRVIKLENFFELRKVIDALMIRRFKFMYYSCLACSVLAVIVSVGDTESSFFISSVVALVFLIVDLFITTKGSLPLNALAHTYNTGNETTDWEAVRIQWLNYMKYRGVAITIGIMALLAGLVFGKN